MAKTPEDLREEAKKVAQNAKKKEQDLIKKAVELEKKLYSEIGKKAVAFVNGKIEINDLIEVIKNKGFTVKSNEKVSENDSNNAENSNSFSVDLS